MLVDGQISQEFDVTTGGLQGDTLAPFLFIIVIDCVMKNAESDHTNEQGEHGFITNLRQSQRRPTTTIHDLDFADDIALLESNFDRAQMQLITTVKWADKVGLQGLLIKTLLVTDNTHAPGEKARLIEIKDQRVTNIGVHLLISCTIFAAPTIRKLPVAALFGIFLYFGTVSISGTQLFSRIKMAFIPTKYYSNIGYLRRVYITTLII
ncbi:unnamed protein product [Rotaria sp. Silwood2]|nr:unnamed protein product [Rotaria sp. Silwood2]CAF2982987.1 unnamed protein product [Rotaria sp. Silwood2]